MFHLLAILSAVAPISLSLRYILAKSLEPISFASVAVFILTSLLVNLIIPLFYLNEMICANGKNSELTLLKL